MPYYRKAKSLDNQLYVNGAIVNARGKHPVVVVRHADAFENGEIIGIMRMKILMVPDVKILNILDWEQSKNDEYFEEMLLK